MSIRIGILGYGNLGRGVEAAIAHNPDMELVGVFTRRDPASVKIATAGVSVYHTDDAEKMQDQIDVMIICGGSATDLPKMTPKYAAMFNVVDSFDTHAHIPEHFAAVDAAAKKAGKIDQIAVDPGRRREGLGRAVVRSLLSLAAVQGADLALLEVETGNTAARALYRGEGFTPSGEYRYLTRP